MKLDEIKVEYATKKSLIANDPFMPDLTSLGDFSADSAKKTVKKKKPIEKKKELKKPEILDVADMLPTKFECKTRHRWVLEIDGVDKFLLKSCQMPKIEYQQPIVNHNDFVMYGRPQFSDIEFELYDAIAPSATQEIMEWAQEINSPTLGKRDAKFKMLDAIGTVVSIWDIKGMWPVSIEYDKFDYATADALKIKVKASIDSANLVY